MNQRTEVSVALATFNGEQYLDEQLESIASQTYLPGELVVGDDGSTDQTLAILERFGATAPFPVRVFRNPKRLGYADNFLTTAQRCRGDWIAFCDQDDVWLPQKLADVVNAIELTPSCSMILQNALICGADLSTRGRRFPASIKEGLHEANSQFGFWVWPGFLKTIRQDIINNVQHAFRPRDFAGSHRKQTHDKWTCMIANSLGGIYVIDRPAAFYRRHAKSVSGSYHQQNIIAAASLSAKVGASEYSNFAEVAAEYRDYLNNISRKVADPAWEDKFRKTAVKYRRLEEIYIQRAQIFSTSLPLRLRAFYSMIRLGAYTGDPFHRLGLRALVKDMYFTLRGARER